MDRGRRRLVAAVAPLRRAWAAMDEPESISGRSGSFSEGLIWVVKGRLRVLHGAGRLVEMAVRRGSAPARMGRVCLAWELRQGLGKVMRHFD